MNPYQQKKWFVRWLCTGRMITLLSTTKLEALQSAKALCARNQAINPFCTDKYSSQAKKGFLCWKIRKQICQIRTSLQKSHIVTYERSVRNMEEIEEIIGYCYTGDDFIEECKRNVKMAEQLFYYGDWQHPSFRISWTGHHEIYLDKIFLIAAFSVGFYTMKFSYNNWHFQICMIN